MEPRSQSGSRNSTTPKIKMKWKFKKLSNFFYHLCNTSVPLWFFVYQSIFNLSFLVTTFCSNWSFLFYHFSSEAHLSFQGREVRKVSVILQQGRNMVLVNVADKKTWKSKFLNENFFMCTTHCVVLVTLQFFKQDSDHNQWMVHTSRHRDSFGLN